jgi:hypothetical protein
VADRDNNRIQRLGVGGAPPCGDPAHDPGERLRVTATARTPQRFARVFAIGASVACDRPCTAKVSGIRSQTRKLDGVAALKVNVQDATALVVGRVDVAARVGGDASEPLEPVGRPARRAPARQRLLRRGRRGRHRGRGQRRR